MNILERYHAMEYGPAPEARNEADAWLAGRDFSKALFIDGAWKAAASGKTFETSEPSSGKLLAKISDAGAADIDAAVQAATKALPKWSASSGYARAKVLYAIGRAMQRHQRLFAVLESIDNGKPIRESRDIDVPLAIRHFIHHAGWAQTLEKDFPDHKPAGVVGQVIPWNFPLLMLAWKIAPALAAGCTVVLKPAEFTPLTAMLFAEICERGGVPKGVVNIVQGGPEAGAAIVNHPGVQKIAFTGSSEVGKIIRKATAGSGKKLSLELGGKSAFIVFEDADLDSAVEGLVDGIWFNQGQVCCAGSRLLVQEGIAEAFIAKVKVRMSRLRVGSPLDKNTDIGPLVDRTQLDRVKGLIAEGAKQGAVCWQPDAALPSSGYYHLPTLATSVSPANILAQEEVFGPVLATMSFRNTEEAIELANNTRYGLAASVWSENINLALHVAPQLKAGVVWVNGTNMFDAACGFGGYRESGFGREGGREGMFEYLAAKLPVGPIVKPAAAGSAQPVEQADGTAIDRTAKLFIGGKQVRPDGNYSLAVATAKGKLAGEVGLGNRKDIRDAVAAARACKAWPEATAYNRSQVLYYFAENLSGRADEFATRLIQLTGVGAKAAREEVEQSIERLFLYAGLTDKFEGRVHQPPARVVTLALHEPVGVVGIVAPDNQPLLNFVSLVAPALAMGNTVVAVPSERHPLLATDLYQVIEYSDLPAGAINIVTGRSAELAGVLAKHDDVDGLWVFADADTCAKAEADSIGNLKRVWSGNGRTLDWASDGAAGDAFLRRAIEVKNVWVPYGD
ncbi:aldehyde dehydrogenase family protein [Mesorhizobium sp. M2D.F.Ca.ET.185.01.1.1]|uniref:aldehyde dehydrogenase family protein n=3 Tax=Mesorhizobium TaxID=68287 RepID=UPI000FCAC80F|nr:MULTISPECIES: aldehyde dehydrogenase family protein [unclassified Mesorhizobium]TGP51777.1 aldehyde dehydrogenase family protein [bacterium M00.F.Ca.ET.230.01.1.1]TGP82145.1 aldehyde dehydrogenase family protein [bacterium M00.F.Ca.ET.227.01.1.1]TGP91972.1 aldehyde dehydrogenase family protein [bacterium M00.F.Ca.ET.221.01.1.1]TGP95243.1 aldehyde dehydrogenase family protein [bacterium M00.F.Ca.ET.222.01.1.1]TGU09653.1 aldehyde dehydrogenase family protein [bacterium M00.F.Ca.ET.163.01.1.1]